MAMMVITLSNNGKSIHVQTNDLPASNPSFTWAEGHYKIDDISQIQRQTHDQGISVKLKSGDKYEFPLEYVTSVGGILVGPSEPISTIAQLYTALTQLIGFTS